jgi:hypothetical protein
MMVDGAIRASILQQVGIFDLLGVIGALLHMANYTRLVLRPALIMVSALAMRSSPSA